MIVATCVASAAMSGQTLPRLPASAHSSRQPIRYLAPTRENYLKLSAETEAMLDHDVLEVWFPRCVDNQHGGFSSNFRRDWKPEASQGKFSVFEGRMTWISSEIAVRRPQRREQFLPIAKHGLEFLDNVLKSQLRAMLVPLLDGRISVAQRAVVADRFVHIKIESQEQAVEALMASDDSWLRSCGAYAIGNLGLKSLEGELNRCLSDPDPLLRETARAAKQRLEQVAK